MKNILILSFLLCFLCPTLQAQGIGELIKNLFSSQQEEFSPHKLPFTSRGSNNECTFCVIFIYQAELYAEAHNETVEHFINHGFCKLFTGELKVSCDAAILLYGPEIIRVLKNDSNPDDACRQLGSCTKPECNLIPTERVPSVIVEDPLSQKPQNPNFDQLIEEIKDKEGHKALRIGFDPFGETPWQYIMDLINKYSNKHEPDQDLDGDSHSQELGTARGFHWKGRDCNDLNANTYPGRKISEGAEDKDHNCNGIHGKDLKEGKSYEELYCEGTGQLGVAVIGDSAGAHFEIPAAYFNYSQWEDGLYGDIIGRIMDEGDMPHWSGWVGYMNSTEDRQSRSIYQYMRERNRCNHRDYINAGVNGATAKKSVRYVTEAFRRNQMKDQPLLVFIELLGNDVCGGGDHMTSEEVFRANIEILLEYLDTVLPMGSHVITVGLADGRVLWDTLHNRTHPIGVSYAQFYEYLLCLGNSPCPGWQTPDEAVRNNTSERAYNLSQVFVDLKNSGKTYVHFDWDYYDFPIKKIMEEWVKEGHDPADLIEPVDGFHPSQQCNALIADHYWEALQKDHPDWLGEVNPHNQEIIDRFGDQGGY